jgi:transcriptional regulator with XRE-family HTH domain
MTTDLAVTWGERLRDERRKQKLSVRELARRAEISTQYVYLLQSGANTPSDELRVKIAAVLGVRVEDIFSYPQDMAS